MQAAQHPQPQLLIFPADAFHAVVGEFPFREKQRFFLAEKTVEILGKAGGGGFIGGEKEGTFSQGPAKWALWTAARPSSSRGLLPSRRA